MKYYIDYHSAVHWLNGSLILCNDIPSIDEYFWDNADFSLDDSDEIYQYFFTSYTDDDVRWMQKHFPDLLFAYSEKFGLWVLCVDHWGTSWDYVWTTLIPDEDGLMLPDTWKDNNEATRECSLRKSIRYMKTKEE